MTLKRKIELLKEYLKMNNIIELSDTVKPTAESIALALSSSERVNNYRLNQIDKIKDYFKNEIN